MKNVFYLYRIFVLFLFLMSMIMFRLSFNLSLVSFLIASQQGLAGNSFLKKVFS